MVSVYTPNINLEEPARGDQVGTWDTPVNNNMTLLDLTIGAATTIPLAGAPVVLNAAQFQSKCIVFSSTLTANVVVTFPTSFTKSYEIFNFCTGSSQFTVTLTTTNGAAAICAPPGELIDVANLAGQIWYKNLARIGTYWDYGGSSVPNWVSGCSIPPYLICDGSAFSAVTFPKLAIALGGTTLPDARGRARFALNQATARITAGISGIDGNTLLSGGGNENLHGHTHANTLTDPGHIHTSNAQANLNNFLMAAGGSGTTTTATATINSAVTGITINNVVSGTGAAQNMPPAYIGGLVLIRAG